MLDTITPLFLSPMEMALIVGVLVLLFGASKIPEIARSSGKAIGEFQKGKEEVEQELKEIKDTDVDADIDSDLDTDIDAEPSTGDEDRDTTAN